MSKYSISLKYGLLAGIVMIAILMLIYIVSSGSLASFITMVVYMPLIFCMIWGGITYRREHKTFKSFTEAFLIVYIISLTATFMFDTYGYILYKVIDPSLPEVIKVKAIENASAMMEKFGTPNDKMEEALKQMEEQDYTPTLKTQAIRYGTSIVLGAIFSALIALINSSPPSSKDFFSD